MIMEIYGMTLPDMERIKKTLAEFAKGKGGILFYLSAIGVLLGVYSVFRIIIEGHGQVSNTSSLIPWGIQIIGYVYLVTTGCTLIHFFGYTFYEKEYKPLAGRVIFLGIITAIAGMGSLATEMGRLDRMYNFLISPSLTSPMWWMAVWYTAYFIILIIEFFNIKRNRHSDKVMWAAFIGAIITTSTLGSIFGVVEQRVYYYSALLPIYFLFFAFLTGSALTAIVASVMVKQSSTKDESLLNLSRKFLMIGLGIFFLASLWRLIIGLFAQIEGSEVFKLTLMSQVVTGMLIAIVVPFIMLFFFKGPNGMLFVGLFIMLTQFKIRNDLIIGGFKVPVFRAYDIPEVVTYTPSHVEAFIVISAISFVIFLYIFAEKVGIFEFNQEKEKI